MLLKAFYIAMFIKSLFFDYVKSLIILRHFSQLQVNIIYSYALLFVIMMLKLSLNSI